jgi:hypothetical protein
MNEMCTADWVDLFWIGGNTEDAYCGDYPSTVVGVLILAEIDRFACVTVSTRLISSGDVAKYQLRPS